MKTPGRKSWIALGGFVFWLLVNIVFWIVRMNIGGETNPDWAGLIFVLIQIPAGAFGLFGMLIGYFAYEIAAVGGVRRGLITFIAIPAGVAALCLLYDAVYLHGMLLVFLLGTNR